MDGWPSKSDSRGEGSASWAAVEPFIGVVLLLLVILWLMHSAWLMTGDV